MSDESDNKAAFLNPSEQFKKEVTVDPKSAKDIICKFFSVFNVTTPDYVNGAMDTFIADPTPNNQNMLKMALCKMLSDINVPGYEQAFQFLKERGAEVYGIMKMEKDFEDILIKNQKQDIEQK